jgi:hypothetical protein
LRRFLVLLLSFFMGSASLFLSGSLVFFERFPGFMSGSLPAVAQPAIRARPLPLEAVGAM